MKADPLAAAVAAFEEAAQRYRRESEGSRRSWNDETRRAFDTRYGDVINRELDAALRAVENVRAELRSAVANAALDHR
jgi:hypothetical protein